MAERAELESDTLPGTTRLAGGPRTFRVHAPYVDDPHRTRTGFPVLKGLCPDLLDERTLLVMPAGIEPAFPA